MENKNELLFFGSLGIKSADLEDEFLSSKVFGFQM